MDAGCRLHQGESPKHDGEKKKTQKSTDGMKPFTSPDTLPCCLETPIAAAKAWKSEGMVISKVRCSEDGSLLPAAQSVEWVGLGVFVRAPDPFEVALRCLLCTCAASLCCTNSSVFVV